MDQSTALLLASRTASWLLGALTRQPLYGTLTGVCVSVFIVCVCVCVTK